MGAIGDLIMNERSMVKESVRSATTRRKAKTRNMHWTTVMFLIAILVIFDMNKCLMMIKENQPYYCACGIAILTSNNPPSDIQVIGNINKHLCQSV